MTFFQFRYLCEGIKMLLYGYRERDLLLFGRRKRRRITPSGRQRAYPIANKVPKKLVKSGY
jgi:hypothetical protein